MAKVQNTIHKVQIDSLPDGFEIVDGELVKKSHGGFVTGDQENYGLVTYNNHTNQTGGPTDTDVRYSLSSVPRDEANIEAEGGETVLTDLNNDGNFGLYDVNGPRHSSGGVPMYLPEQSFVYSDTDKMKMGQDELAEFGIESKKKITPAKVSKNYGLNKYYGLLNDEYADKIQANSAELMLQKNMNSLSHLAFGQEVKKNFEEGVPLAAYPYIASLGMDPVQFAAQIDQANQVPDQQGTPPGMGQQPMNQADMQSMSAMRYGGLPKAQMGDFNFLTALMESEDFQNITQGPDANEGSPDTGPWDEHGGAGKYYDDVEENIELGDYEKSRDPNDPAQYDPPADPTVERDKGTFADRIGRGFNQFMDSPGMQKVGNTAKFIGDFAGVINERAKTKRGRQAEQDLLKSGMADNSTGMNYDPMAKRGIYDENTGLNTEIITGEGTSGYDSYYGSANYGFEIPTAAYGAELPLAQAGTELWMIDGKEQEVNPAYIDQIKVMYPNAYRIPHGQTLEEVEVNYDDPNIVDDPVVDPQETETKETETEIIVHDKDDPTKITTIKGKRIEVYDEDLKKIVTIWEDSEGNMINSDLIEKDINLSRLEHQPAVYDQNGKIIQFGDIDLFSEGMEDDFLRRNPWAKDIVGYKYGQGDWVDDFQIEYEKRSYEYAKENNLPYTPYFKGQGKTAESREKAFKKANPWAKDITFEEDVFEVKYRKGERMDGLFGGHTFSAPSYELPEKKEVIVEEEESTPIKEIDIPELEDTYNEPVKDWWAQDLIKMNAINNRKRGMLFPWQPPVKKVNYDTVLEDPTRAIAAINEQLNIASQAAGTFGGPQALAARTAQAQGKAALNIANEIGRVNQRNVGTINRGMQIQAQYDAMANQEQDRRNVKMYDDTQKVLQTYMDEKNFDREQYADAFANALTNASETFNLNSIQDYYNIDPSTGGDIFQTNKKSLNAAPIPGEYDWMNDYMQVAQRWKTITGEEPSSEMMENLMAQHAMRQAGVSPQENNMQREYRSNPNNRGYQKRGGEKKLKPYAVPFYTGKMGM